ncbi:hypothetical protein CHM34_18305 [Paludifilum halophilum]|uniref:Uncharacterized protein n=1 Tax=Paludifilum halophilum TaxID=1642702 RepID=A0A235B1B4_9BACL|nr:hypothetical protein CHM34_18305 [Paludifilum halophilum]
MRDGGLRCKDGKKLIEGSDFMRGENIDCASLQPIKEWHISHGERMEERARMSQQRRLKR